MKEFFKKHKKLWITLLIIVLIIGGLIGFLLYKANQLAKALSEVTYDTQTVEYRELASTVSANGSIIAKENKNVSVNLSGVEFETVDVEVGDEVKEGDLLCTFDTSTLQQKLDDAKASLAASEATASLNVSSAERMLEEAQASRDLNAEQSDIDIANAWQDYLRSLTDVETAESAYNDAQQTTASKNGEYTRINDQLDSLENTEITFAQIKDQMNEYMAKGDTSGGNYPISSYANVSSSIAVGTDDWCYLTAENDFYKVDDSGNKVNLNETEIGRINDFLTRLKTAHAYYTEYVSGQSAASDASSWQTKVSTAESTEKSAKTTYENAVKTSQSYLKTYEQKVRDKTTNANSSNSSVAAKEDSLKSSQISASTTGLTDKETISNYEDQIEKCTVTAPISGTVTAVNFSVGDGYTSGSTIVTIEDQTAYQVSAEIDEYDIGKIKVGQRVVIKTNGTDDEELAGKVAEIAEHATSTTGTTTTSSSTTKTYKVKIDINTKDDALKLDMTAKVSIIIDDEPNALTVPYEAVQTDDEGNDYVEVLEATGDDAAQTAEADTQDGDSSAPKQTASPFGKASGDVTAAQSTRRVYITRGIESDFYIQVLGDDLKEGDEVVIPVSTSDSLTDLMNQMGPMGGF